MWLPVAALMVGVALGLLSGGTLSTLRSTPVRAWPLAGVALAFAVLPWIGDHNQTTTLVIIGYGLLIVFALRNLHLVGMAIIAVGLSTNLLVMLANQAMPVSGKAAVSAGIATDAALGRTDLGPGRRLEHPDDHLRALGAIVPVDALGVVITFGDLIALAGLINVGGRLVRPRVRSRAHSNLPGARVARGRHLRTRRPVEVPAWVAPTPRPAARGTTPDWVIDLRRAVESEAALGPRDEQIDEEAEVLSSSRR